MKPELLHPGIDLRDMTRDYLIARSLRCMERSAARRSGAAASGAVREYRNEIRGAIAGFYGDMREILGRTPLRLRKVSSFEKRGYRLENVLFDSFPGMEVNATVYIPLDYRPPYPAVVIPVGHSGKQFPNYQLPAQYFARSGYLAILFDPPGQQSEKQTGNDHFRDGVRCYPVGHTSSRYFIADALRCLDYLETREDADMTRGAAMTGVSGGGTTTTFAIHLDERIRVIGPSCCVTPLADLDITQCYSGCPESHMWRRYAEGIDEVDLLCAAFPTPLLLMAGRHDEVFHIDDTSALAAEAGAMYEAAGCADRYEFFVDESGHAYTLTQARRFTRFMNRWLLDDPDRAVCELQDEAFTIDAYEELKCSPSQLVNMRTMSSERAAELMAGRSRDPETVRRAASRIAGVDPPVPAPKVREGEPFQVWMHDWRSVLLETETDIVLPATFLSSRKHPAPALLLFDDRHRDRLIYRNGPVSRAVGFCDRTRETASVLSVDLRGWGDTEPAMYPYEIAGWGSGDRYLAYTSAALGDPIMAMRIRDGLASLAYLRSRPETDPGRITIAGYGLGGLVALHVAVIDGSVSGVLAWDLPSAIARIVETEDYSWPADVFVPNILESYDLQELASSLSTVLRIVDPLDGAGHRLSKVEIGDMNREAGREIYTQTESEGRIVSELEGILFR